MARPSYGRWLANGASYILPKGRVVLKFLEKVMYFQIKKNLSSAV
jgi:hypothetical protein